MPNADTPEDDRPVRPERVTFTVPEGLTLVGDAWGDPSHPPVLLVHGGGQTRYAWGGTAEALALRGWYAVSIDQRGHGDSAWSAAGNYSMTHYGEDLRAVARAFPRPPAVVGASLGGVAAMIAAGEAAGEAAGPVFSAVVLVDITPRVEETGVARIIGFMSQNKDEGFGSLEEAADAIAAYLPDRPRPKDLTGLAKNLRHGPDGRWRWHWDPRFVGDLDQRIRDRDPERLEAAAGRLKVPVLLVRGRRSDLVTEAQARQFLQLVPHAQYVDVSGAGHMVAGDRNDAFTVAVVRFLRTLPQHRPGG